VRGILRRKEHEVATDTRQEGVDAAGTAGDRKTEREYVVLRFTGNEEGVASYDIAATYTVRSGDAARERYVSEHPEAEGTPLAAVPKRFLRLRRVKAREVVKDYKVEDVDEEGTSDDSGATDTGAGEEGPA
jgi:hypothetical protein